jgi:hypothetical protein
MSTKILFLPGRYYLSGTLVSVNVLFNVVPPLIKRSLVLLMLMLVPAIRACAKSRFFQAVQHLLIFSILDRDGENSTLTKVVYRDGKSLAYSW